MKFINLSNFPIELFINIYVLPEFMSKWIKICNNIYKYNVNNNVIMDININLIIKMWEYAI